MMNRQQDKMAMRTGILRKLAYASLVILIALPIYSCASGIKTVKSKTKARFYKPSSDRHKKRVKTVRMNSR